MPQVFSAPFANSLFINVLHQAIRPPDGRGPRFFAVALLVCLLPACSSTWYAERADAEAGGILEEKAVAVPDVAEAELADITVPVRTPLDRFQTVPDRPEFLGDRDSSHEQARVLTLADALGLAVRQNRDYLTRKEALYVQALDLTLARQEFTPIFAGGGGVGRQVVTETVEAPVDALVQTTTVTTNTRLSASALSRVGTRIATNFTTDFLRFVSSPDPTSAASALTGSIVQPLLQGAGTRATTEALTQAERDLMYAIRDFARFRQDLSIDIASQYYRVLQARDAARNAHMQFTGFQISLEREEALAEEDRRTQSELGRLRQAALNSELSWINAVRSYEEALDDLKLDLGLPVDTPIALLDDELDSLTLEEPGIDLGDALRVALDTRLDLLNTRERYEDAVRRIAVASNDLLPGLDLSADISVISSPEGDGFPSLDFRRRDWSVALDLDLPLDRKSERNQFRAALIDEQSAARALEQRMDEVKLDLINAKRELAQARRQHEISSVAVALAERRIEEEELLLELGRGDVRDLVDARSDLLNSRNQLTAALVNHTTARLRFWRDVGILYIQGDGAWVQQLEPEAGETTIDDNDTNT